MTGSEEIGKVATATIDAMKSAPLAIALLVVNLGFIGFNGFVLARVAENAAERNKSQTELISRLVAECRVAPTP